MEFIKTHKKLCILIGIILVAIILIAIILKSFNVDYSKSEYGDRLKGIDKVEIKKETIKKLEEEMNKIDQVEKCTYRLKGRLINIAFTMKDGVEVNNAKEIANKVLDYFSDKEKSFYDIQVFIKNKNNKKEGYPVIGQKHKTSDKIVW